MINLNQQTKSLILLVIISFFLIIGSIAYWSDTLVINILPWTILALIAIAIIGARLHEVLVHLPHRDKHLYSITIYKPGRSEIFIIGYSGINSIQIRNKKVIISGESSDIIFTNCSYSEIYNVSASNKRMMDLISGKLIHYNKLEVELILYTKSLGLNIGKVDDDLLNLTIFNGYDKGYEYLKDMLLAFNAKHGCSFELATIKGIVQIQYNP